MRDDVTLFVPGDGVKESSNSATYKGVKEFKINNNGTCTFKTLKHGTITTNAIWRLKAGLPDDAPTHNEDELSAGNQARRRQGY